MGALGIILAKITTRARFDVPHLRYITLKNNKTDLYFSRRCNLEQRWRAEERLFPFLSIRTRRLCIRRLSEERKTVTTTGATASREASRATRACGRVCV